MTPPGLTLSNGSGPGRPAAPAWASHLEAAERALAEGSVGAATRHWDEAHLTALGDHGWEGLVAVGTASLRVAEAGGDGLAAQATARRLYFAALFRASRQHSLDGVLKIAEAFAALGDRDVIEECVGLAELIPETEAERARVRARLARLGAGVLPAGNGPRPAADPRT